MMKKMVWMMVLVFSIGVGAQANLLTNGDFNTGDLTGWWTWVPDSATQSITVQSAVTYDSTPNVLMASATDGNWQELGQSFVCTPGTTYKLDFVYNSTGWLGAGINLKYMDSGWGYINYEWISLLSSSSEGSGTWTPFSYTFTTPAGTGLTEVKFTMGGWGNLYVDNVNVVPEPATLVLLGLGGLTLLRKRV
jgi:hypothetical protein